MTSRVGQEGPILRPVNPLSQIQNTAKQLHETLQDMDRKVDLNVVL